MKIFPKFVNKLLRWPESFRRILRFKLGIPFLLQHCVRPYQYPTYDKTRITGLWFPDDQGAFSAAWRFKPRAKVDEYYFAKADTIVGHFASDFSIVCDEESNGLVIKRLERIFDSIFIDKVQDLAGYDLELLRLLFASQIHIEAVGDNRQVIYQTNYISTKNKAYRAKQSFASLKNVVMRDFATLNIKPTHFVAISKYAISLMGYIR